MSPTDRSANILRAAWPCRHFLRASEWCVRGLVNTCPLFWIWCPTGSKKRRKHQKTDVTVFDCVSSWKCFKTTESFSQHPSSLMENSYPAICAIMWHGDIKPPVVLVLGGTRWTVHLGWKFPSWQNFCGLCLKHSGSTEAPSWIMWLQDPVDDLSLGTSKHCSSLIFCSAFFLEVERESSCCSCTCCTCCKSVSLFLRSYFIPTCGQQLVAPSWRQVGSSLLRQSHDCTCGCWQSVH